MTKHGPANMRSTIKEQKILYRVFIPRKISRILKIWGESKIPDFKQVFQFDSPQISQILKILRKMQTREKIFQMKVL